MGSGEPGSGVGAEVEQAGTCVSVSAKSRAGVAEGRAEGGVVVVVAVTGAGAGAVGEEGGGEEVVGPPAGGLASQRLERGKVQVG